MYELTPPLRPLLLVKLLCMLWLSLAFASGAAAADGYEEILSPVERAWLNRHPGIKLRGYTTWPPLEFEDESGQYSGISGDFMDLLEQRLNYRFERSYSADWPRTLELMAERRIGVITGIARTEERAQFMDFTEPYFSYPMVMVTRRGEPFLASMADIGERKVVMPRDFASVTWVRRDFPDLNIIERDSVADAVLAVANGDADILIDNIPTVNYEVQRLGVRNLTVAGVTPYQFTIGMGVRQDWPQLTAILNKGLASISRAERDAIYQKWIQLDVPKETDYRLVYGTIAVALVLLAAFYYWNRKLAEQVRQRQRSERALRDSKTALKEAKAEAERMAQAAQAASASKSEFLANMSHEIRTPMNAVIGYTELLERDISDPQQRNYLESIKVAGQSLLTLINDILDLSKVEAGKLVLEPVEMRPRDFADRVRQIFRPQLREKKLSLEVEIDASVPEILVLDETRLRQVIFNLVGNAIKFTDVGYVRFALEAHECQLEPGCINLSMQVEDTGIGIEPDQQTLIFNAFEQQQGQNSRQYEGSGLGLAISKKLVEAMGGEIQLMSKPNVGSCFQIDLPGIPVGEAIHRHEPGGVSADAIHFRPALVLVVDDYAFNRDLIKATLSTTPLRVTEAENGEQALLLVQRQLPDLVLMDIRMPVMDGYAALDAIRRLRDLPEIPIVALTASVVPEELNSVKHQGFDGFLRKPVTRDELFNELARHLAHDVAAAESADAEVSPIPLAPLSGDECGLLREHLKHSWEAAVGSGDVNKVQAVLDDIQELQKQVSLAELVDIYEGLLQALSRFDFEAVERWLVRLGDYLKCDAGAV